MLLVVFDVDESGVGGDVVRFDDDDDGLLLPKIPPVLLALGLADLLVEEDED